MYFTEICFSDASRILFTCGEPGCYVNVLVNDAHSWCWVWADNIHPIICHINLSQVIDVRIIRTSILNKPSLC